MLREEAVSAVIRRHSDGILPVRVQACLEDVNTGMGWWHEGTGGTQRQQE
jgi:hypothetical protein